MPLNDVSNYFRQYDKQAFQVVACQGNQPSEADVATFETQVGFRLPDEFRQVVAVAYRLIDGGPQFMVIDAAGRPVAMSGALAATAHRRDQVIGTPLASEVFAMLDAIWAGDYRIRELSVNVV